MGQKSGEPPRAREKSIAKKKRGSTEKRIAKENERRISDLPMTAIDFQLWAERSMTPGETPERVGTPSSGDRLNKKESKEDNEKEAPKGGKKFGELETGRRNTRHSIGSKKKRGMTKRKDRLGTLWCGKPLHVDIGGRKETGGKSKSRKLAGRDRGQTKGRRQDVKIMQQPQETSRKEEERPAGHSARQ